MARQRAERVSRHRIQIANREETAAGEHYEGVPSRAAILGHPLHPMLIPFPIAFLTALMATDLVWWQSRDAFWARVSAWLLEAGLATGVVAALVGLVDFIGVRRVREHAAGWLHFFSAVLVLGLAAANLVIRAFAERGIPRTSVVLSVATAAVLGITGWYGGELSFRHLIGIIGHGEAPAGGRAQDEGAPRSPGGG